MKVDGAISTVSSLNHKIKLKRRGTGGVFISLDVEKLEDLDVGKDFEVWLKGMAYEKPQCFKTGRSYTALILTLFNSVPKPSFKASSAALPPEQLFLEFLVDFIVSHHTDMKTDAHEVS